MKRLYSYLWLAYEFSLYFKLAIELMLVWGVTDDVNAMDARIRNLRPKEYKKLRAIRIKYHSFL